MKEKILINAHIIDPSQKMNEKSCLKSGKRIVFVLRKKKLKIKE